jgi:carboxyl-terminal processing protease
MNVSHQPYEPAPPAPRPASAIAALVLLVLAFVAGVAVGGSGILGTASQGPSGQPGAAATQPPDAPSDFALFWQALNLIRQDYVGRSDLTDQQLTYGAIRGLVEALGDTGHTVFLTPEQVQSEQDALNGSVVGIGVLIGQRGDAIVALSVVDGGPAQVAGMRAGDQLTAVDGQSVSGLGPDEVASRVRGPAGTTVTVTVLRPSTGETLDFRMVRSAIKFPSASWAMVPGTDIAVLRLIEFSTGSADELAAARDQAIAAGAHSLILDLRGNPGGYVDQAVNVASLFLHDKTVFIRELADGERIPVMTNDAIKSTDLPLAVLIDENTASSAEITAGALESAGRAAAIGQTTFGTGTILGSFPLADGSAIRLAIERWLTPDGQLIFGHGITPTIPVALAPNEVPLEPAELAQAAPQDVTSLPDSQLVDAIEYLSGTLPSPAASASASPAAPSP